MTGAGGQVGRALIERGVASGIDMPGPGHGMLDITRPGCASDYMAALRPDMVINAAAYTAVDRAESEPEAAYAVNRDGPASLADACREADVPLLHISTDYVFDGALSRPYRENDEPNPRSVYGKSKLEGERAVAQRLDRHIILRVAWVFSAHGENFVKSMLRLGAEREELGVVDDQKGAPTWADDIASVLLNIASQCMRDTDPAWGIYHYTGTPETTWYGFSRAIFDQAVEIGLLEKAPIVHPIRTEQYPTPAARPGNSALECRKLLNVFGIDQADWHTGLGTVLQQWRADDA